MCRTVIGITIVGFVGFVLSLLAVVMWLIAQVPASWQDGFIVRP